MAIPGTELSDTLAALVEGAAPSLVRVDGGRRRPSTGVVWQSGVVVTASHTVHADEGITVDFGDGAAVPAALGGRDPATDIALLKIDPPKGAPARIGKLDGLKVGHLVLMLGRPGKTVRASSGIVSALGTEPWRTRGGTEIERYLEADAPHQPGFSGGPLVALDGRVLGINTTAVVRGVSLTIPSATVQRAVDHLLVHGTIRKSYLGLSTHPVRLPDDLQQKTGEEVGLLVQAVEPGGPAEKAGILYGDTILRLGPDTIRDLEDLQAWLRQDHVGETVVVKLLRAGQVVDVNLTLGQR
jgi:S1-C subfamily serine protease